MIGIRWEQMYIRKNRKGSHEWTTQSHCQHLVNKPHDEYKQNNKTRQKAKKISNTRTDPTKYNSVKIVNGYHHPPPIYNWFVCFNNISVMSWLSVLLVEKVGVPGENYRPVACHRQTLSYNVVHLALIENRTNNISDDCIASCKSNYRTIMTTKAPGLYIIGYLTVIHI